MRGKPCDLTGQTFGNLNVNYHAVYSLDGEWVVSDKHRVEQ